MSVNLDEVSTIYFIGIGGIAMSSAAGLAKARGFDVVGSDETKPYSPSLNVLENENINFHYPFSVENIQKEKAELYIASAGVGANNVELKYAEENGFKVISLPEFLALIARDNIRVVVSGTHGKSTTTAIIGTSLSILEDSSYMIGGVIAETNTNFRNGDGNYFVMEGDEYKASVDDPTPKFHYLKPDIVVLTNLEYDHPDLFESPEALYAEFEHLLANLPEDGIVIYNADDAELEKIVFNTGRPAFSYGENKEANVRLVNYESNINGTEIEIESFFAEKRRTERYNTSLFGEMNVKNALACITLLRALGFSEEQLDPVLKEFKGLKRRFELVGVKSGIVIIDDYAHHPTEVEATLATAKLRFPGSKIWAVFEPHTFSRTEALLSEFQNAFFNADEVILPPIYPAREKKTSLSVTSEKLVEGITNTHARVVTSKEEVIKVLKDEVKDGDVVVIMAVGDFNTLAQDLVNIL